MPLDSVRTFFQNTPPGGDDYDDVLIVTIATPEQPGVPVAPSPVFFEVASVTGSDAAPPGVGEVRDPQFHDITYVWDFGDPLNATPSTAAALRMPAVWKDINKAYGRRVCHVYSDPSPVGGYTVTVTAYERSTRRKGSATVTVTVGNPQTTFTGTRTIIFDPNAVVADPAAYGYPGASIRSSWATVLTARNALGATTGQILFAPGAELVGTQMCSSPNWGNIRFGALDPTQPKPVVRGYVNQGGFLIQDESANLNVERVVFGLRFVGDWDSTLEQGRIVDCFRSRLPTVPTYLAMQHRCEFDGWASVGTFSSSTDAYTSYAVHSELDVTNWQNYGLTTAGDNAAVIACVAAQHPDALSGGQKDTPYYNNHGSLRDFNTKSIHISVCDMFSRNGWSAGGTGIDGLALHADQAALRLNANGEPGCSGNIERLAAEGMIWIEEQDTTGIDVPVNYVFDKVIHIMGPRTIQEGIELRYGGCTFRNMLGVILNAPSAQTNRPGRWFWTSNEDGTVDNDAGIDIYNCTLVDLRSNANANNNVMTFHTADTGPGEAFANIAIVNNVFEQPNRSPPLVPDAVDLSTPISGIVPRHRGPRVNFLREAGTLASDVAPGGFFTLSYADVKTTRYNQALTDSGAATDQAYWLAASPAHPTARHKMEMGAATIFGWTFVDPMATFEPTEIRIWNRTASTWTAGTAWTLQLDRRNALPAWDALGSGLDVRGVPVPLARSPIGATPVPGKQAFDDMLGTIRSATGDTRGALLPA